MAEKKDWWDKTDVLVKGLWPVVAFVLAFLYRQQQDIIATQEKTAERVTHLAEQLASNNDAVKKIALMFLQEEKKRHPDDVPQLLFEMIGQELVKNLAASCEASGLPNQPERSKLRRMYPAAIQFPLIGSASAAALKNASENVSRSDSISPRASPRANPIRGPSSAAVGLLHDCVIPSHGLRTQVLGGDSFVDESWRKQDCGRACARLVT